MASTIDRFLGSIPDTLGTGSLVSWHSVLSAQFRALFVRKRLERNWGETIDLKTIRFQGQQYWQSRF